MTQRRLGSFTADALLERLRQFDTPRRYVVALSGGCDSIALLHASVSLGDALGARLSAVHVNHRLQAESDRWEAFCQSRCSDWAVPLHSVSLDVLQTDGKGLEAAARGARYQVFGDYLEETDILLLAHHLDDQVETVLLNLFNGAGIQGLAGMPRTRAVGRGRLYRPLLDVSRDQLRDYAESQGLQWIEDPSNQACTFDRNYLRQRVLPDIKQRFPAIAHAVARSSSHCRSTHDYLHSQAESLLSQLQDRAGRLSLDGLKSLDDFSRALAVRAWAANLNITLSSDQLGMLFEQVIEARQDASPRLQVGKKLIRRNGRQLECGLVTRQQDADLSPVDWDLREPLDIPALGLWLEPQSVRSCLRLADGKRVTVRFRHGGEMFRAKSDQHACALKDIFQKLSVPAWKRKVVPLVYVGDELVMIYGYAISLREQYG